MDWGVFIAGVILGVAVFWCGFFVAMAKYKNHRDR